MNFIFDVNSHPFGTRATIIPVVEVADGTSKIYRKVYYNNLKDFLMTDLFEGYIHGHYLWRCDICDRYFFMTTARNQLYCSTVNKKYGVPCSYIAKHPEVTKRKMKNRENPTAHIMFYGKIVTILSVKIKALANTVRMYLPRQRSLLIIILI